MQTFNLNFYYHIVETIGGRGVEKIEKERGTMERRGMLEESGSPSKGRSCHCYGTTTV